MVEMNASTFYENVFEISKNILEKQISNGVLQKIILEIDKALIKLNTDLEQSRTQNVKNYDYSRIHSRDLCRILEVFKGRSVERDKYLEVFPEYQKDTVTIISALSAEAEKLRQLKKIETPKTAISAVLGGVAGILRFGSIFSPLSAGLSIVMNVATVFNGTFRAIFTTIEHIVTEKHMESFEELMYQHKILFDKTISRWVIYDDCLMESVKAAIGSKTAEKMFKMFKTLHEKNDSFCKTPMVKTLNDLAEILIVERFPAHVAYPVVAGLLKIFWLHYGSHWITNWDRGALPLERAKTAFVVGIYSAHTGLAYQNLKNRSNSFFSTNSIVSALGTAIDVLPSLSDALLESEISMRAKKIKNKAKEIEQELDRFNAVYEALKAEKAQRKTLNIFYRCLKISFLIIIFFFLVFKK